MKTLLSTVTLLTFLLIEAQEIVHIKMRSISKPIIQAEINGKKGYFLVDTGADISVINSSELERYQLDAVKTYGSHKRAIAYNGNQSNALKVNNANVVIGDQLDHSDFYSLNLDEIAKTIEAKTHLKIVGIIGADLLLKYHCVIDYNQRNVSFVDSKSSKRIVSR